MLILLLTLLTSWAHAGPSLSTLVAQAQEAEGELRESYVALNHIQKRMNAGNASAGAYRAVDLGDAFDKAKARAEEAQNGYMAATLQALSAFEEARNAPPPRQEATLEVRKREAEFKTLTSWFLNFVSMAGLGTMIAERDGTLGYSEGIMTAAFIMTLAYNQLTNMAAGHNQEHHRAESFEDAVNAAIAAFGFSQPFFGEPNSHTIYPAFIIVATWLVRWGALQRPRGEKPALNLSEESMQWVSNITKNGGPEKAMAALRRELCDAALTTQVRVAAVEENQDAAEASEEENTPAGRRRHGK